jgi:hypothetical protein
MLASDEVRESPRGKATLPHSTRDKSLERTTPGHDLSARGNVAKVFMSDYACKRSPTARRPTGGPSTLMRVLKAGEPGAL